MANYVTTDTELTAMADAIREKLSSSSAIPYEENKGFADAIGSIPQGGGTAKFANGSVTLTSGGTDNITIEHGLGVTPNCVVYLTDTVVGGTTEYTKGGWHFDDFLNAPSIINLNDVMFSTMYNTWRSGYTNKIAVTNIDEDYFDLKSNSIGFPPNGCTFYWFALYIDKTQS